METPSSYFEPRQEDDIDLVSVVRDLFVSHGLAKHLPEAFDGDQHIVDALNKKPAVQRHLLNRYLNLQLMKAKEDSSDPRYCLINDGRIEEWVGFFTRSVLPFCVRNQLPTTPSIRAHTQ